MGAEEFELVDGRARCACRSYLQLKFRQQMARQEEVLRCILSPPRLHQFARHSGCPAILARLLLHNIATYPTRIANLACLLRTRSYTRRRIGGVRVDGRHGLRDCRIWDRRIPWTRQYESSQDIPGFRPPALLE